MDSAEIHDAEMRLAHRGDMAFEDLPFSTSAF